MDSATLHSGADATLFEIVRAAASAVAGDGQDPVGRLTISELCDSAHAQLELEATVSAHGLGWTIEQLDVLWHGTREGGIDPQLVETLCSRFGAGKFSNLILCDASCELMDFTLSFASRLPFLGRQTLLAAEQLTSEQLQRCREALAALAVTTPREGLDVARRALRSPPTAAQQARAFASAARASLRVELYTSQLPATHAVRIAQDWTGTGDPGIDLCISFGLSGNNPPSAEQGRTVQQLLQQHFALRCASKSFQVVNAHGNADEYRAHGVIPERRRKTWSLNWGQRG